MRYPMAMKRQCGMSHESAAQRTEWAASTAAVGR
jgi:hypothetical protein